MGGKAGAPADRAHVREGRLRRGRCNWPEKKGAEEASAEDVFCRPAHSYTRLLQGLESAEGAHIPEEENGGAGSRGAVQSGMIHGREGVLRPMVCGPVRRGP